jgi:hypothetical protein
MGWLHRFLHPHCQHCIDARACQSCDVLKIELERTCRERDKLLDTILNKDKPQPRPELTNIQPVTRQVPWHIKRQQLEQADREEAAKLRAAEDGKTEQLLTDKQKEVESLEKELGVSNG